MAYVTVSQYKSTEEARGLGRIWLERATAALMLPIAMIVIATRPDLFEPDLD